MKTLEQEVLKKIAKKSLFVKLVNPILLNVLVLISA